MLTITHEVSDADLMEAIRLRFSTVIGSLSIANALAGHRSTPWRIVHQYSPRELLDEARARNLRLEDVKCAVEENRLVDHPTYQKWLKGEI